METECGLAALGVAIIIIIIIVLKVIVTSLLSVELLFSLHAVPTPTQSNCNMQRILLGTVLLSYFDHLELLSRDLKLYNQRR